MLKPITIQLNDTGYQQLIDDWECQGGNKDQETYFVDWIYHHTGGHFKWGGDAQSHDIQRYLEFDNPRRAVLFRLKYG